MKEMTKPDSKHPGSGPATPKKLRAGIVGGAGYTAGELIRLLINHPQAEIAFVHSKSHAGKSISEVHKDLIGETALRFSDGISQDMDLLFLCLGHGEASSFLQENELPEQVRLIDLSQDFRLAPQSRQNKRNFVYGLPELNKEQIKQATAIANPGCFATAIELGLLPLAKAGLLTEVYATGITGSTGAGQGLAETSHFSWRANNIQAYKTLSHQHLLEIHQTVRQLQQGFPDPATGATGIHFVPWRGDFTRGIFVSSQMVCNWPIEKLMALFQDFYKNEPFTIISTSPIFMKQVVNTNKCLLQLEKQGNQLVVHSAIDNLLKGASGHAVQNMNLMFGLEETLGLKLKANYF